MKKNLFICNLTSFDIINLQSPHLYRILFQHEMVKTEITQKQAQSLCVFSSERRE